MTNIMEKKRRKMQELLEAYLPEEKVIFTSVKRVKLFRTDKSFARTPTAYDPRIIILAQGKKNVFIGNDIFTYDPSHYLVLSVPLPVECEAIATPEEPILGFSINVDSLIVGELLLEMVDRPNNNTESIPKGIYGATVTDTLIDAAIRLLLTLASKEEAHILGNMIVREIIYRVLCGENGEALKALAYHNQRFFQIARILDKIHQNYNDNLNINALATDAGMSVTTFHSNFKAVTNSSPLQYIKNVRLHKARTLMNHDGLNVYSAALQVGYESPSQFNREYKRLFGITPAKDTMSQKNYNMVKG